MRLRSKQKKNPAPLVVDVDGTLIKSDLLIESFLMLISTKPLHALASLGSLMRGRAAFKARVASETKLDTSNLPFNPGIWALLKAEKRKGRKLYLASAFPLFRFEERQDPGVEGKIRGIELGFGSHPGLESGPTPQQGSKCRQSVQGLG